ncbi:MAG: ketopantoate reductase family protein [Solirubrobacteraceae bacterium]
MTRIAVLGPGGVGGLVAAALACQDADGAVTVVAREGTAELIARRGLTLKSAALGDFVARPSAVARLEQPVDVLVVATKASGLSTALKRIATAPGLVVPLLNGLDHLEVLRDRLGAERVVAAVIRVESDRSRPGEIVQTSPAIRVDMASARPQLAPALQGLAALLRTAGIEARIGVSEPEVMWSKLARLCPLALTTSAFDATIGEVRSEPETRAELEGTVAETIAVANADGAALHAAETLAELDAAHASLGSSMRRDIAAGRPTELDAVAGAVLRAGERHGLRCPTVAGLARCVAARTGEPAPTGEPIPTGEPVPTSYSGGRIGSAGPSA